jgi:hypothetical protein
MIDLVQGDGTRAAHAMILRFSAIIFNQGLLECD